MAPQEPPGPPRQPFHGHSASRGSTLWTTGTSHHEGVKIRREKGVGIGSVFCQMFAAAVELRRLFPGITDNAQARECARTIAGWQPLSALPLRRVKLHPKK